MRPSNKQITETVLTQVEQQVTTNVAYEEFNVIQEFKGDRIIIGTVAYYDETGKHVGGFQYSITGEYYNLLMSESPSFAPNKPANEYREADLWYIIDLMNGQN